MKCASFSVRAKTKTFSGCRYARRFTNVSEWRRTAALTGKYYALMGLSQDCIYQNETRSDDFVIAHSTSQKLLAISSV